MARWLDGGDHGAFGGAKLRLDGMQVQETSPQHRRSRGALYPASKSLATRDVPDTRTGNMKQNRKQNRKSVKLKMEKQGI